MPVTKYFQTGWIVDDIDRAIDQWLALGNTGPFYVNREFTLDEFLYRGRKVEMTLSSAFAQAGPIQIELIQQHTSSPSPYRDVFQPGSGGFHHLCALSDDLDLELERLTKQGFDVAGIGQFGSMRFGYVDTRCKLGAMLEFAQVPETVIGRFKLVADAAVDWDGRDPIRSFG